MFDERFGTNPNCLLDSKLGSKWLFRVFIEIMCSKTREKLIIYNIGLNTISSLTRCVCYLYYGLECEKTFSIIFVFQLIL